MMFELHPRLAQDCIEMGEFELCLLLLCNDANYPWFIMVPKRDNIREIYQLPVEDQHLLIEESSYLSQQLELLFNADKMNVAALGNMVPQLHIHHIVRFSTDPAWPGPIWGKVPGQLYLNEQIQNIWHQLKVVLKQGYRPLPL